eukprot:NODE_101_length_20473_cov_0.516590.p11 type:complete len:118 gc:universal NODE_101_length_20473_cov_0.516590:1426-1073(-)
MQILDVLYSLLSYDLYLFPNDNLYMCMFLNWFSLKCHTSYMASNLFLGAMWSMSTSQCHYVHEYLSKLVFFRVPHIVHGIKLPCLDQLISVDECMLYLLLISLHLIYDLRKGRISSV